MATASSSTSTPSGQNNSTGSGGSSQSKQTNQQPRTSGGSSVERRMGDSSQQAYQKLKKYLDDERGGQQNKKSNTQQASANEEPKKPYSWKAERRAKFGRANNLEEFLDDTGEKLIKAVGGDRLYNDLTGDDIDLTNLKFGGGSSGNATVDRVAKMLGANRLMDQANKFIERSDQSPQKEETNSSVLDGANYGKRPYEQTGENSSNDTRAKNMNFQQEMKDMMKRQEQFNQGGSSMGNQTADQSNLSRQQPQVEFPDVIGDALRPNNVERDKQNQQTERAKRNFRDQNQQALSERQGESDANRLINSGNLSGIFGGLWELARGRGRRFVTASTGIGVFLAIAESDLILYNRFFKKGTVKILPGSRPEGAYEADPSLRNDDYKELGINLTLHVMGVVMIFGAFLQALPILFPFMVAVLGAAVLQNELGPAVADLLLQLAN
jgi:hypothetical protein